MFQITKENKVGYLFMRNNIDNPKIKNLLSELQLHLFETNLIIEAFKTYTLSSPSLFDNSVGDCKCQTRTSMLLDMYQNKQLVLIELQKEYLHLINIQHNLKKLLNRIDFNQFGSIRTVLLELENLNLKDFLKAKEMIYNLSPQMKFIGLLFFISLKQNHLNALSNNAISSNKINQCLVRAKKELCDLSIQYELHLAKKYCSIDIQKSLNQTEEKGFCSMTPFFSSFKPIFEKIKYNKEPFIQKTTHFCLCGGITKNTVNFFMYNNKQFIKTPYENIEKNQPIMIIYGFQYPGSFAQLKNILNISEKEMTIPKPYHQSCKCDSPTGIPIINNIEEAILANFAHHPQFTNDTEIDWQGQDLVDSDLHKEYQYLKTLSGFSLNDMSNFCIDHIYPATIKEALEQDSSSIMAKVIEQKMDFITHYEATHCPC